MNDIYTVELRVTKIYRVPVEECDEDTAIDSAWSLLDMKEKKYYYDTSWDAEVVN